MSGRALFAATLLLLTTPYLAGQETARLIVRADYAIVELLESAASRRYVALPSLEFPLTIEPICPAGARADSISISVADTHDTIRGSAFDDQAALETIFRVPQQQIGPLPIEHFCVAGEAAAAPRIVRIRDVLTAQASLRCVDEGRQAVVYDVVRLHVELRCQRPPPPAEDL